MPKDKETGILTIAAIRKAKEGEEILFNEHQQIFRIPSSMKSLKEATSSLKMSYEKKLPIKATLDLKKCVVEKIDTPKPGEIERFRNSLVLLENPTKSLKINVKAIDPTAFNIIDLKLKWPAFLLCTKVVPSYAKAKEIFDFCAAQSCHLPGPYGISPCIPFQYVRDGCYARAHKMRRIITTKYGYCCEKVFSFANQGSDRLAVQANKWGGCCVTWWYHVAPLIRVRVKILSLSLDLAMVIDPGMFDKPVLLSTWLSAQENTLCHANANVSMYSIQPGSAYSPANYAGTAFTTDPAYTATDATLTAYSSLTTCP